MYFYCIPSLLGSLSINMLVNELYKQEYLLKANFRDWVFNCPLKPNSKPNLNKNFTLGDTIRAHLAHLTLLLLTQLQQVPSPASSTSPLPATTATKGNSPELQSLAAQLCPPLLYSTALWHDLGLKNNVKLIIVWYFFKTEMHGTRPETKEIPN